MQQQESHCSPQRKQVVVIIAFGISPLQAAEEKFDSYKHFRIRADSQVFHLRSHEVLINKKKEMWREQLTAPYTNTYPIQNANTRAKLNDAYSSNCIVI